METEDTSPVARLIAERETDTQKAERIKARIRTALIPVLEVIDESAREGFLVEWQLGRDHYGRQVILNLYLLKKC